MKNTYIKQGQRYYGISAPIAFWSDLKNNPRKIKRLCNGAGSTQGWFNKLTFHLIPNTFYGLNITEATDVHDYRYTIPERFSSMKKARKWKERTDSEFLDNLLWIIERDSSCSFLRNLRRMRAMIYYSAVVEAGEESFFKGKVREDFRIGAIKEAGV